ncbi:MAG: phosphate/phosphite/phosphonate ABC transporter substrate-binding protein [Armatimonadota bacterium]|nr:phosphate/phosphite/phosphonate ABC transporter substrate-binding protein [Armatimonadota bacterium]
MESPARAERTFRAPAGVLRLAVAPVYSPRRTFQVYRDLAAYLGRATGLAPEMVAGKTYAEINDLVRTGDVTLAVVCTLAYVEGQRDFGMEALAVPVVAGRTVYYSYLIVPTDSPARGLEDLRGGTFAFSDPLSNSGRLAPVYRLLEMGETPESFFRRYIFTYSHDNSIQAVARKVVDGAAVDSLVYDYVAAEDRAVAAATRLIARWGPYGINPVVVHPRLAPGLKQRLREIVLTMHADPTGRQLLARLHVDRFVVPDDRLYDPVRVMWARVRGRLQGP